MTFSDFQSLYSKRPRYRASRALRDLPSRGLTKRSQNRVRQRFIDQENLVQEAAERALVKECAKVRTKLKADGRNALEIQLEMIRLKLIPDVRVETVKKKRKGAGK